MNNMIDLNNIIEQLLDSGYTQEEVTAALTQKQTERDEEAKKRAEQEAMAAQFQTQKEKAAEDLLAAIVDFLKTYYPDLMETLEFETESLDGLGAELVKELDASIDTIALMAKLYGSKGKTKIEIKTPKAKVKAKIDPIADFLKEFGLN